MEIKNVNIKFFKKNSFSSYNHENVKHVKILPCLSVVQSVEGSYDIALGNGEMCKTGEGGFFIAPSDVQQTIIHHDNRASGKMTCRWIFIDAEINKIHKLDSVYQFPLIVPDSIKPELNALFDELFSTDDIWESYSCCYKILGLLLKTATESQKRTDKSIQSAIDHITENYTRRITIEELARVASMSESSLYATFKKQMGISPIAYLNNYRLSLAADLLSETDEHINNISYAVGINDPLYFSKTFKRIYGMTPREYRSRTKQTI